MQPGSLQGGFAWLHSVWRDRLAVIDGRATLLAPITTPRAAEAVRACVPRLGSAA